MSSRFLVLLQLTLFALLIQSGCSRADTPAANAQNKIRVLFVGGDWKSQLPNFQGKTPLRGFFVKQEVEKVAPGKFDFTLWTSYEFLQYGDANALQQFDVIVCGDTMGQSVMPHLVQGLSQFVQNGGGFWYCDNHKAFSFNTKELSFDDVLPLEVVPFRPFSDAGSQPLCNEKPLLVKAAAPHPILQGLDLSGAPAVQNAHYGVVKNGATIVATSPAGKPIWVAWDKGQGRALWTGGVFANDELSAEFSKWPQIGQFYAQSLTWLAAHSKFAHPALKSSAAGGTLTVDISKSGPALTAKHFGIHGQEDAPGGSHPMTGEDLKLYQALNLDGTFARTSPRPIKTEAGKGQFDYLDDGTDLSNFDWSKYDFKDQDTVLADIARIQAEPLYMYWVPWKHTPDLPDAKRFTKYFAAALQRADGISGTPDYKTRVQYFELMNEPNLGPMHDQNGKIALTHEEVLNRFTDFFNYAATNLRPKFPGVKFGMGGFYEWQNFQEIMDKSGKNLDWISRHPYGHTGEAIFYLQDEYQKYARARGLDPKFIITEWDFWIYGEPAFDYIMQRWKPVAEHADSCVGTLQYRWREYQEGGYVFGVHGEFNHPYGELPPEWPNPGKDKPITYRYNAFWAMRDARGPQFQTNLDVPALQTSPSPHAYAIASSDGQKFNIVIYNGAPISDAAKSVSYDSLKLHILAPIPPQIKGRTLEISRADAHTISEAPAQTLHGDKIELNLEIPARSAVSLTVK